jgi:tetratricopeptide (TPR) repeat protein
VYCISNPCKWREPDIELVIEWIREGQEKDRFFYALSALLRDKETQLPALKFLKMIKAEMVKEVTDLIKGVNDSEAKAKMLSYLLKYPEKSTDYFAWALQKEDKKTCLLVMEKIEKARDRKLIQAFAKFARRFPEYQHKIPPLLPLFPENRFLSTIKRLKNYGAPVSLINMCEKRFMGLYLQYLSKNEIKIYFPEIFGKLSEISADEVDILLNYLQSGNPEVQNMAILILCDLMDKNTSERLLHTVRSFDFEADELTKTNVCVALYRAGKKIYLKRRLKRLLKCQKPDTITSFYIGYLYKIQGKLDKALGALENVGKNSGWICKNTCLLLASIYYQKGKLGQALKWIKSAITSGIDIKFILQTAEFEKLRETEEFKKIFEY